MPKIPNRHMKFRIRGFLLPDGSEIEVFGNEPAPTASDGSALPVIFDQDVYQETHVTDHVDTP